MSVLRDMLVMCAKKGSVIDVVELLCVSIMPYVPMIANVCSHKIMEGDVKPYLDPNQVSGKMRRSGMYSV